MAEWNLLPKELVQQISSHLKTSIDLLRFRSVCSSWRSSLSPISPAFFHPLNYPNLGLLTKRTVFLVSPPDSTSPRSSWIVKIDGEQESPKHLLNPLSRYRFNSLPSGFPRPLDLRNFRILELSEEYFVSVNELTTVHPEKVAITWLNGGSQFMLLARGYTSILALYESAGKKWTLYDGIAQPLYFDVIAYNDRLYAADANGKTVRVGPNANLELVANPLFTSEVSPKDLVECRGQLLLVILYRSSDPAIWEERLPKNSTGYVTAKVFKLDEESQSWIAVKCMDDQVLFLGEDSNFSLSAADLSGCSGNCIFFLDNHEYEAYDKPKEEAGVLLRRDIGVFELGTGSMGLLGRYPKYAKMFWPPPDWISSASLEERTQNDFEDS